MLNSLNWGWNKLNDETIPWVSSCSLLISPVLTSLEIVASLSLCKVDEFSLLFQRILSCSFSVILFFKSLPSFLFASYRKSILSIGANFTYSPLCFIFFALMMLLIILLGFHCRVLSKRVVIQLTTIILRKVSNIPRNREYIVTNLPYHPLSSFKKLSVHSWSLFTCIPTCLLQPYSPAGLGCVCLHICTHTPSHMKNKVEHLFIKQL